MFEYISYYILEKSFLILYVNYILFLFKILKNPVYYIYGNDKVLGLQGILSL